MKPVSKFGHSAIVDFWCGNVLIDVTKKSEILKCLNKNKDKEWGLNTNVIYL